MNCQEFQSIVRDYSRGEWTNASQQSEAQQHLSACPSCRLRLETESALNAALSGVRMEAGAPLLVEQAVLAAFRQQRPAPATGWKKATWVAIGLAAGFLLAALALRPRAQEPIVPLRSEVSAPAPAQQPEVIAPETPQSVVQPVPRASAPKVTYAKAPNGRSEFIPLRYGKPLESGEPVQVIRIALPRSELVRMGLPVAMDGGATTVKADVLLGEDGLAKAIRFVY